MRVPLLDLTAHHRPIRQEILTALHAVMENEGYILGPAVSQLEARIAAYCKAEFGIGVSSGTDALLAALMALAIGPEDEVITTPYSFFATAGVVARLGAKPVFVDIDPVTYNIHPGRIEAAITPKTKAILPVHLYGQSADMTPILAVAQAHHLFVVEDAAQAIGADYFGKRAGGMGDFGCFSFFPSKNLGGWGDGGMVVTQNADLAERVRILRNHGANPKYIHKIIGGNFRLDTLQAAVLNVKLNYLDGWTKQRQTNAEQYRSLFRASGLIEKGEVRPPESVYADTGDLHPHIYNQFVIRVRMRDRLHEYLKQQGIGTEIYYPLPFHLQGCFQYLHYKEGDFPEAEQAAKETLALPIYPELSRDQQEGVVAAIVQFYEKTPSPHEPG